MLPLHKYPKEFKLNTMLSKSSVFYMIFVVTFIFFMSCKSSNVIFDPQHTENDFLTFGIGGGFTGKVTKYFLTPDGNLYIKNGDKIQKIGTNTKEMTNQIFSNYEKLGLNLININEPGNKYSFIERNAKSGNNVIMWGKQPLDNKNIETYFAILMNVVKKVSPPEAL